MTGKGWLKGFVVLGLCSATALLGYGVRAGRVVRWMCCVPVISRTIARA